MTSQTSKFDSTAKKTEADLFNEIQGKIKGYDCPLCKNKGIFYLMSGEELVSRECSCMKTRRSLDRVRNSGLEPLFHEYTFDKYKLNEIGQTEKQAKYKQELYDLCMKFVGDEGGRALLLAGQAGVGKTHLCTAVCDYFINAGLDVRYFQWKSDTIKLKTIANLPEYPAKLEEYKNVDVLYIDDLFLSDIGSKPTSGDINIAFDIINHRYINRHKLITLMSTNLNFMELMSVNEAIASRIYEMCGKKYVKIIPKDPELNHRFFDKGE